MNPYKFSVKFRLEKRENASGEYPINADITFACKRVFFFTGHCINEEQWNQEGQQVRRNNFNANGDSASDINSRLNKIRNAVEKVFADLAHTETEPTPKIVREALRSLLNEGKSERRTVAECYRELVDDRKLELDEHPETAQWAYGTWKKHNTMLNHWLGFKPNLYFEDITHDILDAFEKYLIAKGLSNGYVSKSMVDFSTFLNWAVKKGYNRNLTFREHKQQFTDGAKGSASVFALNEEELNAVISVRTASRSIARTRDMFLFCCYTGLRYSDVVKLRWDDIFDDGIDVVAQKTHQHIRIPLNNTLRTILGSYKGVCEDGLVFPKISNQKYNEQLKTLGRLAGLNREWIKVTQIGNKVVKTPMKKWECLSSHVARRTFVTYALRLGLQPEVIRSITGHTTSKMMQEYVRLDQTAKQKFMEKLDGTSTEESADTKKMEVATAYDLVESVNDIKILRKMLAIPEKDKYLRRVEKEPMLAVLHLAVFLWNTQGAVAAAPYIDILPPEYLDQFYYLMATTRQYKAQLKEMDPD